VEIHEQYFIVIDIKPNLTYTQGNMAMCAHMQCYLVFTGHGIGESDITILVLFTKVNYYSLNES